MKYTVVLALLLGFTLAHAAEAPKAKPNVLFIAIDDLRDWIGVMHRNPQTLTPNLDKLAARGTLFTRNYCAAPVCNPSRAALMSGMRPGVTGIYQNDDDWRTVINSQQTLNVQFKNNGWLTLGSGKIYHEAYDRKEDWDDYLRNPGGMPSVPKGVSDGVGGIKFAPLDCKDEDLNDWKIVNYAIEQLGKTHDKPVFLACGIHKPHMPWNVPRKYYDMHPLDKIELPPHLAPGKDLEDVPPSGKFYALHFGDHEQIIKAGQWKNAVQGYLAAISYTDMLIGRLMAAVDASPMKENMIIVVWGDHGWHLGEKEHWRKFALWEETTRSPLIWYVPGMTKPGSVCDRTVDFMSVYPTLCDLCGIPIPKHVQGPSIKPLLQNSEAAWNQPALTTHEFGNHAVRMPGWRYIRYQNGDEELYNETLDPNEWTNLAGNAQFAAKKAELKALLPKENKDDINGNSGYAFKGGKKFKGAKAIQKKMNQEAE
jgi:arylsulfatase A-like enzyme